MSCTIPTAVVLEAILNDLRRHSGYDTILVVATPDGFRALHPTFGLPVTLGCRTPALARECYAKQVALAVAAVQVAETAATANAPTTSVLAYLA